MQQPSKIDPKIVHESWSNKKSEKAKNGGDGVHAAPPQKHSNFKDPTEVIYLKDKCINKKLSLQSAHHCGSCASLQGILRVKSLVWSRSCEVVGGKSLVWSRWCEVVGVKSLVWSRWCEAGCGGCFCDGLCLENENPPSRLWWEELKTYLFFGDFIYSVWVFELYIFICFLIFYLLYSWGPHSLAS